MAVTNDQIAERFWSKVDKSGDCWIWTKGRVGFGYGAFYPSGHKQVQAHRFAWELTYGAIPVNLQVLHNCDNPPCCNPAHLFLGTQKDNMQDCNIKGRARAYYHTHPPQGELCHNAKLSLEQVQEARLMRSNGWKYPALAKHYGVTKATIRSAIIGRTWNNGTATASVNTDGHAGERNPNVKLTWEQVREIRHLYAGGAKIAYLASSYHVGHTTVRHIINGNTWKEA